MTEKIAYNATEGAAVLGISKPTLYKLMRNEGLPFVMAGGRRLIPRARLEAWLERKAAGGDKH